jgi:hypothetical protein
VGKKLLTQATLAGLVVLLVHSGEGTGQLPPQGGQGGGRFGGMRGGMMGGGMLANPDRLFDMIARGRESFAISESRMLGGQLAQWAQENGVTDGQITRERFRAFADAQQKKMAAAGMTVPPGGGPPGLPGQGGMERPRMGRQGGGQDGQGGDPADRMKRWVEWDFSRRDGNGDKSLNTDEMPDGLRDELSRYDTNRDNLINLEEYTAYMEARAQQRGRGNQGQRPADTAEAVIIEEDLDRRPVVLRAGKLPKELDWFKALDTDGDGQIGLYEWRTAKRAVEQFHDLDRNDDGFITPEEGLRSQGITTARNNGETTGTQSASAGDSAPRPGPQVGPPGGFPRGNFGPGAFPKGMFKGKGMKKFR